MAFPSGAIPGIDVSHYQAMIDWSAVAAAGEAFAFAKASEGVSAPDVYFADNWSGISSAGILRGAYHFFLPDLDPAAQAKFFLARLANANGGSTKLAPGDLPAALDLEIVNGVAPGNIINSAATWLAAVEQATGRKPILYTYIDFWKNKLGNPSALSGYPLWIAQYSVAAPTVPGGWTDWALWQFSSSQPVSGVSTGSADVDAFNGTINDLRELAGYPPSANSAAKGN
jgi:lysozyme